MHCPECGFVNAEGANYCQKCGAYLATSGEFRPGETTEAFTVDQTGELKAVDLDKVTSQGATLVIRMGGVHPRLVEGWVGGTRRHLGLCADLPQRRKRPTRRRFGHAWGISPAYRGK